MDGQSGISLGLCVRMCMSRFTVHPSSSLNLWPLTCAEYIRAPLLSGSLMVPLLKATLLSRSPSPSASRGCPFPRPLWVYDWQLLPETQSSSYISGNPDHISVSNIFIIIFSVTLWLCSLLGLCLSSFTLPNQEDFIYLFILFIYLAVPSLGFSVWGLVRWPGIKPWSPVLGAWISKWVFFLSEIHH